jgi:glutathione S-transferase
MRATDRTHGAEVETGDRIALRFEHRHHSAPYRQRKGPHMLTLYFAPGSSAMAPHIALHEVGAKFEARPMSFRGNDNRTAEFLAMNPEGKVPTLSIGGRVMTEVAGILFYLARRFPEASLLPLSNIEAEAQIVSWMSFIASTIHPARRLGPERLHQVFQFAEHKLANRPWAAGDYSIADIHLFRLYWRWVNSDGPKRDTFPGLTAHFDRMMARPAVRRVLEIESAIGYQLPA